MSFKMIAVLNGILLLVAAANGGVMQLPTTTVNVGNGALENITLVNLPHLISINCTGVPDTHSLVYVSEEMFKTCDVPTVASMTNEPPLNRLQCPSNTEYEVDYLVRLRAAPLSGLVFFELGKTYYFVLYNGDNIGSLTNTSCVENGTKFAIHLVDPTTITTPTPTPTSTVVSSSLVATTMPITTTTDISSSATTSSSSSSSSSSTTTTNTRPASTTTSRGDGKTTSTVLRPTTTNRVTPTIDFSTSGVLPASLPSVVLTVLLTMLALVLGYSASSS